MIAWGSSIDYGYTVIIYEGGDVVSDNSLAEPEATPPGSPGARKVNVPAQSLSRWSPQAVEFRDFTRGVFDASPTRSLAESGMIPSAQGILQTYDAIQNSFATGLSEAYAVPSALTYQNLRNMRDLTAAAAAGLGVGGTLEFDPFLLPNSRQELAAAYVPYYREYLRTLRARGLWPYVGSDVPSAANTDQAIDRAVNVALESSIPAITRYRTMLAGELQKFEERIAATAERNERALDAVAKFQSQFSVMSIQAVTKETANATAVLQSLSTFARDAPVALPRGTDAPVPQRIRSTREALSAVHPARDYEVRARDLGLQALDAAEARAGSFRGTFNDAEIELLVAVGTACADIALGLNPVTGFFKDVYELATGTALIGGRQLSDDERLFAAIGVLTLSTTSNAQSVVRAMTHIANSPGASKALSLATRYVPRLPFLYRAPSPLKGEFTILAIQDASEVNVALMSGVRFGGLPLRQAPEVFAPFQNLTVDVASPTITRLARVHSTSRDNLLTGRYLVSPDDIAGLTFEQMQRRLGLSYLPDKVSVIQVPPHVRMTTGEIAPTGVLNEFGTRQFWLHEPIVRDWVVQAE